MVVNKNERSVEEKCIANSDRLSVLFLSFFGVGSTDMVLN